MSVAESVQDNVNSRTVQLVKLLAEVGPDIPEISRKLGQFKESVRYRYKEKILSKGFSVQAAVDHEALGLKRVIIAVDMADPYLNYAQAIFSAMNEFCYLVGFTKELIGNRYQITLSVPSSQEPEVIGFFEELKQKGMFSSIEVLRFDWSRVVPMKAEFYDFDSGRWDFEFAEQSSTDARAAIYKPSERSKFDFTDLLLLKEFQMDANKSLKVISDGLGINYKKLAWHYNAHVKSRKMIRGYMINWMGTRYNYALEKALHRKHRYLPINLVVRNANEYEMMALRERLNRLPFLWAEGGGQDYYAVLFFPVDSIVEGMQYLGKITDAVKEKSSLYPMDQTDALTFTISYKLFDAANKKWVFESSNVTKRFEELIIQIKAGAG